jgi:hypothetical protein
VTTRITALCSAMALLPACLGACSSGNAASTASDDAGPRMMGTNPPVEGGTGGANDATTSGCFALSAVDKVRFYPRSGQAARMKGGMFQGSNESPTGGFVDLATIAAAPPDGQWTTLSIPGGTVYRYFKYYGPPGSFGDVADLQFQANGTDLMGVPFGTTSADAKTHTATSAFDGDFTTYFEGAVADAQYVGLDLAAGHIVATPTISPPGGRLTGATQVTLASATPGAVIHYSTDGSDPAMGMVYAGPFTVSAGETLKAIASASCSVDSPTAEALFTSGPASLTAQSSFHIGNSLTGPILNSLPNLVASQKTYSLDFHNCVTAGVDVGNFWQDVPAPGCYELGVNPLPTPEAGVADPKVALADPTLLPPIDNLVVQPFAAVICTPYSDAKNSGDGAFANNFYQLAKAKNNPSVQLWIYQTWAQPVATDWSMVDCFANGGYGTPPWPGSDVQLVPVTDWESAMHNHILYHEEVRKQVDLANGVDPSSLSTPGPHALIVPMGLALLNLKHEIEAGNVHDVKPTDFFTTMFDNGNDLHISFPGEFFDALVFYSVFFKTSPEGLPVDTGLVMSAAEGADFERIAWNTAASYPWSGITTTAHDQ